MLTIDQNVTVKGYYGVAMHVQGTLPTFILVSDSDLCAIVQRYGGVYAFSVQNGQFILWLSL